MKFRMLLVAFAAVALLASYSLSVAEDKAPGPDVKCPVSGAKVNPKATVDYNGGKVYFCCEKCPKEFAKDHTAFHIVTKVNGVVKQDVNTKNLIWDEAHMIRYLTSILTLYPGDIISSGTPDGVGAGRRPPEFLKPGDVVTIDIDGIGTLTTPMRALAAPGTR